MKLFVHKIFHRKFLSQKKKLDQEKTLSLNLFVILGVGKNELVTNILVHKMIKFSQVMIFNKKHDKKRSMQVFQNISSYYHPVGKDEIKT